MFFCTRLSGGRRARARSGLLAHGHTSPSWGTAGSHLGSPRTPRTRSLHRSAWTDAPRWQSGERPQRGNGGQEQVCPSSQGDLVPGDAYGLFSWEALPAERAIRGMFSNWRRCNSLWRLWTQDTTTPKCVLLA
uniref:Uncharacterized protein n=1 Tax=Molossus molossus TaxID=27622 RepID=A0A7J8DU41_MOLMO|nr:hypothetical protein HJG59_009188 [Molossus molossus]